jgi:hypothetical protein
MDPGREAATVRHVVLVVILVGAAFLGGAFINGPGMRWVQTQVLGSLGLGDEREIATVDLSGGNGAGTAGSGRPGGEKGRGPIAPMPSALAAADVAKPGSAAKEPAARGVEDGGRRSTTPAAGDPAVALAGPARDEIRGDDGPPPLPADLETDRLTPARRDPEVTLAAAAPSPIPPPSTVDGRAPLGGDGPPALGDSSGAPAPPAELRPPMPDPSPSPVAPQPRPAPGHSGDDDWGTLARKMQVLGISRFTIEGQPGGQVVFSCLIPMAGRHAVSQRFEAEGPDAVGAARAALRRVALWRAAQPQASPSQSQLPLPSQSPSSSRGLPSDSRPAPR